MDKTISSRQSIQTDGTALVTFTPALVVKAGNSMSLDVIATMNASGLNSRHSFAIVSAADVDSSANAVNGNFVIKTPELVTTSYAVSKIDFTTLASNSGANYKVGDKKVEI